MARAGIPHPSNDFAATCTPNLRSASSPWFSSRVERTDFDLARRVEAAGRRFSGVTVEPDYVGLEQLAALAADGMLRPHIQQTFPLEKAASAHGLIETGRMVGKVVLTV